MREAIQIVWKISVLTELALAIRLFAAGLAGTYPALQTASIAFAVKSAILIALYAHAYPRPQMREVSTDLGILEALVVAWIVYEIFSSWTKRYRGIGAFGKTIFLFVLLSSFGLSLLTWGAEIDNSSYAGVFRYYYVGHRVVLTVCALFLIGMRLFFRTYPALVPPNVQRYTNVALFYFGTNALAELIFTLTRTTYVTGVNLAIVSATTVSFAAWALLLDRVGGTEPVREGISTGRFLKTEQLNDELLGVMDRLRGSR